MLGNLTRYDLTCEATVPGSLEGAWAVWTDMPSYPQWDPREEELRLDGPFAEGVTGFSKQVGRRPGSTFVVTRVEPMTRWVNECPLPGGRLVMDHRLSAAGDGAVHLVKRYEVHGPLAPLFRLFFAREIRRGVPLTFAALAAEAARRPSGADGRSERR